MAEELFGVPVQRTPKQGKPSFTVAEWLAEAKRLFGDDPMKWAFVCPVCKHRQTVQDYKDAGAPETVVAFSCVGRWLPGGPDGKGPRKAFSWDQGPGPCDYAGGGLFRLNPVIVVDDKGEEHQRFAFAEPEATPDTAVEVADAGA